MSKLTEELGFNPEFEEKIKFLKGDLPLLKRGTYKITHGDTHLYRGIIVPKDVFKWHLVDRSGKLIGKVKVDFVERTGKDVWTVYGTRGFDVLNSDFTDQFGTARGAFVALIKAHQDYKKVM
jgi:hypothetical protein